jgi:hypothetical protein
MTLNEQVDHSMVKNSFIARTGQRWKFVIGFLGAGLSVAVLFWSLGGGVENGEMFIVSFVFAVLGCLLGMFGPRCPKCGAYTVWKAMNEKQIDGWYASLENQERCAACNYLPPDR